MSKKRGVFAIGVIWIFCFSSPALSQEITEKGTRLLLFYNHLDVEHHWLKGNTIDWESGVRTEPASSGTDNYGYAAEFVAAVCKKLKIRFPGPDECREGDLLINEQYNWIKEKGKKNKWEGNRRDVEAQRLANEGNLVIAIFPGKTPGQPGHIALVRPANLTQEMIEDEGVQLIQAGTKNYTSTSAKEGFREFPSAFTDLMIQFFSHKIEEIK